jgi:hypothetical protein
MSQTHSLKIRVGDNKNSNPKVDHNITITGLIVTDADKAIEKLERQKKGLLKGLYVFKKKIPTGEVYICNGAEFPNAEAVDLLLYLLIQLEKNNWNRKLTFKSLRELIKNVYESKNVGKTWAEQIKRGLVIWKNHSFYFPKSFVWEGNLIEAYFGVIEDFKIKPQGRGKPAKVEITFNETFIEICKNTTWYRRPPWAEMKKLRKEVAKRLYMLALEFKPAERSREWKIYIDNDLKEWYRNSLNSLANPKYLKPYYILKRLKGAIEEINQKTNLRMEFQQTEEGNYCIAVEEIHMSGVEKLEIPFDKLPNEDKAILVAYVEAVAKEKKIQNVWGFLRSMSDRQVKRWLKKAKEYFNSETSKKTKKVKLKEKPELLEILRNWGSKEFSDKPALYRLYFGEDKVLKAYEGKDKVVFVCVDKYLAHLLSEYSGKLKEVFGKGVSFVGQEEALVQA